MGLAKPATTVIDALNCVLKQSPQSGFWKCFGRIRRQDQVREMAWSWRMDYNEQRPHVKFRQFTPAIYRVKLENSSLDVSQ